MQLRNYQINLKNNAYRSWQAGNRNVLLVSPTGSGKTVVMSSVAHDMTTPGVAIAHRTELVGQISLAMARMGIEHNVIGSKSTVSFCIQQQIAELGRNYYRKNGRVTVASVDTLNSRSAALQQWASQQRWWMTDECFVAGTRISTPTGQRAIEKLRVGDTVVAYSETDGSFVPRRVKRLFKNPAPKVMVKVAAEHHVLYTTSGHPFWTVRGWVNAAELKEGDLVLSHTMRPVRQDGNTDQQGAALSLEKDRLGVLQPGMRVQVPGRKWGKATASSSTGHDVPHVLQCGEQSEKSDVDLPENWQSVLQQDVLDCISRQDFFTNNGANECVARIGSHEEEQPHVQTRGAGEGFAVFEGNWAPAENPWWQRHSADGSGKDADEYVWTDGVHGATCGPDGIPSRIWPEPLQDRLRAPEDEDCDRSGRVKPFRTRTPSVGCAQGSVSQWCRVDSVAFLERDDPDIPGDRFVYNIEVDEHHTYVAEGIVVHNCHHLLSGNKWGKAVEMLPNAHGLGVTATPVRADRKSLHADQGGVFHDMVVGPSMRDLIDQGALCDYRIFSLPQSIDTSTVKIGSTGDYSQPGLRSAAHDSKIVGDVVQHYLRFANGLRGITFTVDVEQAIELAKAFTDAGVPAMAVSAKTPDAVRAGAIQKFRAGEIMQLVNVDLFGEGFDVPAVEVVSMARPTMSYGLFVQQFGRALRTLKGKSHGIILDHVGNVQRHGLPDAPRQWSLYNENYGKRGKRDDDGVIPVTSCPECFAAYERVHKACPHCGHVPEPAGRSLPEQVDGDLIELDPSVLAEMRGEIDRIDGDAQVPVGADAAVTGAVKKRWRERQEAQQRLRDAIALWAGVWRDAGEDDSTIHRRFFLTFGTDVMTAQTLNAADAAQLKARVSGT